MVLWGEKTSNFCDLLHNYFEKYGKEMNIFREILIKSENKE